MKNCLNCFEAVLRQFQSFKDEYEFILQTTYLQD